MRNVLFYPSHDNGAKRGHYDSMRDWIYNHRSLNAPVDCLQVLLSIIQRA